MCLQGLEGEKGLYTRPLSGQCRQQAGDGCGAGEAPVSPPGHEGHSKDQVPITSSCRPHPGGLGEPVGGVACPDELGDPRSAQGCGRSDWAAADAAWA